MTRSPTPSDPVSGLPADPAPRLEDLLLDRARGELDGAGLAALEARLAADPALRERTERILAFDGRLRTAQEAATAPGEDIGRIAARIATRVRDQVGREESLAERGAAGARRGRRLLWGRVLALSVAAHVILLGVLAVLQMRERQTPPSQTYLHAVLPDPGLADDDLSWREELPDPIGEAVGVPSPALPESVAAGGNASRPIPWVVEDLDLVPLADDIRHHPRAVAVEMVIRRIDALKRRQLSRFGSDAAGTMRAVKIGLEALARRHRPDGSFAAAEGRTAVGETALALLPFLADGRASRTADGPDPVVAGGVAWLRGRLFADEAGELTLPTTAYAVSELGMALKTLSEDYMVSFGRLAPGEARRRALEIRSLAAHIEGAQNEDGSFGDPRSLEGSVWPMWSLTAAVRTGAAARRTETVERFAVWYGTHAAIANRTAIRSGPRFSKEFASGLDATGLLLARELGAAFAPRADESARRVLAHAGEADGDPLLVLASGSGLFLHDPTTFRSWNESVGARLLASLSPTGLVWRGNPVGDTALVLLALQTAYRSY